MRTGPCPNWLEKHHHPPLCLQVAGPLPLRWGSRTGGSTECSPQSAVDARSTATAAGRGSPSPTPSPPPHRKAASRSLLDRGQGAQPPWSRAIAESRAQTSSAALRAGAPWRPHPYRRQHLARFRKVCHRITATGSRAALLASATTVCTLRSTMPPDWPKWRS